MAEFFRLLLAAEFKPHVFEARVVPDDPWLVAASDLSIAAAHFAIMLVLWLVISKTKDQLYRFPALLFGLFMGFRGATQVLAIWTVWHPGYQLGYGVKTCTVVLSVLTAVVLVRLIPVLHRLPSAVELQAQIKERLRAEEAVREKEERFRNFVESVQDYAMYIIDPAGVIETWNSGAERIKGYTAEEAVGSNFARFFSAEDQAKHQPADAMAVAHESGSYHGEGWQVRKDGSRLWARVSLRPLLSSSGTLRGFAMITRDLTGSREMEAKYQSLLEAAPDAMVIVNRQGRIEFVNKRMEELFGYPRADLLGRSVDTLVPERFRGTHGKHRHGFFNAPHTREMGAGQELSGLRRDGSEFALEISLSPLDTKDGPVALAAVRDVTERKKAETRFRSLLESAPDAMVIVNSDGFIELANRQTEKLFGYSHLELVGHSVDILVPIGQRAGHGHHRTRFVKTPNQREMGMGIDLEAVRKDGSTFPVEISLSPLDGPDGMSVTAAIRDVTERKLAVQQLAEKMTELSQSNEALEQFAHIASHDLQEPLRMVASYTQLLAKRYKGRLDADADEFIEFAVDGTRRMKALIEDLLLYSRAGRGAIPLREVSCDLCLQQALNNLFSVIRESEAEITHEPLPTLRVVESQLVQVFQNLVGNAIKYRSEAKPSIHVSAKPVDKEWIFTVKDNGIGVEPRHFERIFVIFQRLHAGNEYSGTGIGLAICKRTLQQQGGRIWLESEPGHGSTFYFALPMR